ncbi:V-type proton ATPase subunit G 1-like [Pseudophryne corroboree]|uniref:V-type proton ATPase subunit G 1-like n=1 Tax=Pseudophryne corroboree TaxID=495146 RepID=UPI003081BA74
MEKQSAYIQQLFQAEKRAAEIVAEARQQRIKHLKRAREEAQAEIEQFRLQHEKEFKVEDAAALEVPACCKEAIGREALVKIAIMKEDYKNNREMIIEQLVTSVCIVEPKLHVNYHTKD